jgi:molybdopterin/thiamine biosynthesis adenylyltransferase
MDRSANKRAHSANSDRLDRARVLVVGMGALGCPAAVRLAESGVGTLILVDPDRVEISNLPRQTLYREASVGKAKVDCAARALRRRRSGLRIETHRTALTAENAVELVKGADFAIDATDNVAAKFAINDAAVACNRAFCHAGVLGFRGQVLTVTPGTSTCLRCLFPEMPPADEVATCEEAGILGPIAGLIGALQAGEAIGYLLGGQALLRDELLTYEGKTGSWRKIALARNPRCPVCAGPPQRAPASPRGEQLYGGLNE